MTWENFYCLVNQLTGISISNSHQIEYDQLLKINENLHKKIIGQNYVILKIIDFLIKRIDKSGENKPFGIFLFIGKLILAIVIKHLFIYRTKECW